MLTEKEEHKIEIRRQSQNEERYFSTELVVKWRSSLPKDIAHGLKTQYKFTRQTSIRVLDTDFCGLERKEIYKEVFLHLPWICFPRHLVNHYRSWTSHSCIFLSRVARVGVTLCIFQPGKQGGTSYPNDAECFLSGLLHKVTWTSSLTFPFSTSTPPTKHTDSGCCPGSGKHVLPPPACIQPCQRRPAALWVPLMPQFHCGQLSGTVCTAKNL